MKTPFLARRARAPGHAGSTLLIALLTVTVISFIAANALLSISSRYDSAYRSAGWNEALVTAQAGINTVSAEIAHLVPNVIPGVNSLGNGYTQPSFGLLSGGNMQISPTGVVTLSSSQVNPVGAVTGGNALSVQALYLTHAGEGSTEQQATVTVGVTSLSSMLDPSNALTNVLTPAINNLAGKSGINLLHLVSTGTVYLRGSTVAGMSRQDNDLWRVSLMNNSLTHAAVSRPQVSRQIEVYLRPVFAFDSAVASNDSFLAASPLAIFDSFNSTLATASTNGKYDSLKRQSNATLRANGNSVTLGGKVYGNVDTNGGSVPQDGHVTGTVNNASYCPLPVIATPTWQGSTSVPTLLGGSASVPSSVTGTTVLPAGVAQSNQYRFNGISGNLHITGAALGAPTSVEICVDGDVTGGIELDPGVTAKIYVSGSIAVNASQFKNDTGMAANMQIYGVPSSTGGSPQIFVNLDTAFCAAVYAPLHRVIFNGSGDVSGAAVGATVLATGAMRFHYDESLAYAAGVPLVRYQGAGWRELVAN